MVAKMASCGAGSHLEDGDGDVPAFAAKDNLIEGESSGSEDAGSSTDDSSEEEAEKEEEEEEDEEEEEEEAVGGAVQDGEKEAEAEDGDAEESKKDSTSGPEATVSDERDERLFKVCCEKCKAVQQSHGELVTPRRLSKGRFQVLLEAEGTYECAITGLVFEAAERVLVRYWVLSWAKYGHLLQDSWRFAGPLFNVDTVDKEASALKSIQFPHSLCLADPESEMTFSVLHIKDKRPLIEPTADHSGSHIKWNVTSLSPVGPIMQTSQPVEHHGVVLLYKRRGKNNNDYSFHVYLAPNSRSEIEDIRKQVRTSQSRYMKIDKPATCKLNERMYRLTSEPEGEIKPEELDFTFDVTQVKGYFEVFFEQPPPFKLSLIETKTDEVVWSTTIREGDCVDPKITQENTEKKSRKRTNSRKGSGSQSEEETTCKRARWNSESDGVNSSHDRDLTERQMLLVANELGEEWKQVAIFLGLSYNDVNDIKKKETDGSMQRMMMLVEWSKKQPQGERTALNLLKCLDEMKNLPYEVRRTLQDMMGN